MSYANPFQYTDIVMCFVTIITEKTRIYFCQKASSILHKGTVHHLRGITRAGLAPALATCNLCTYYCIGATKYKVEVIANMIGTGQRRMGKYELYKRRAASTMGELWMGYDPQSRSYAL